LREWHALGAGEREAAWQELVDWVAWLHDRYELSVEERLPTCWHQHPGLIEELHALRVWRLEIYAQHGGDLAPDDSAAGGGSGGGGQAARYWHAELRQVLQAASTWYAAGCRSGHRSSAPVEEQMRRRWLTGDPVAGIPADVLNRPVLARGPGREEVGMALSQAAMQAALDDGSARTLGELITEWVEYDGTWWTPVPADPQRGVASGWERITDPSFNAELDTAAAQMRAAD